MVPFALECCEEDGGILFKVEAFDETVATIEMKTVVNATMWREISPLIEEALLAIDSVGDQ